MHVYASLVPTTVRSKVDGEGQVLLHDIQELEALLQEGRFDKVAGHQFRAVETYFRLKYTLSHPLSVNISHGLVKYVFQFRPALEKRVKALNTVMLVLKKTRKAHPEAPIQTQISWETPLDEWEANFYASPLPIQHSADEYVTQYKCTLVKFLAKARTYYPQDASLWFRLAADFSQTNEEVSLKAAAQLSLLWPAGGDAASLVGSTWIDLWGNMNAQPEWDFHWLRLFARVVKHQQLCQTFDITHWAPHLPFIFSKIQQAFHLPSDLGATPAKGKYPSVLSGWHGDKTALYYASKLSVELLENSQCTLSLLQRLLSLITPFYHPSSAGNAANGISDFVYYVSAFLSLRLGREKARGQKLVGHDELVAKLVDLSFLGLYSKSQSVSSKASFTFRNAITIVPSLAPSIVEKILRGLDPSALNQTHQAPSAISALTVCGPALLRGDLSWTEQHLPLVLQWTLPGIDPNDDGKTSRTLQLYSSWLMYLPLADDTLRSRASPSAVATSLTAALDQSQVFEPRVMSSDTSDALWRAGPVLESWVLVLLDRLFLLFRNHDKPAAASSSDSKKGSDAFQVALHTQLVLHQLFVQLSPPLYKLALQRVVTFLQSSFLPHAGKAIAGLVRAATSPSPELAIQKILLPAVDVITKSTFGDQELLMQLRHVDGVVARASGTHLMPHSAAIRKVLSVTSAHANAKVVKLGCKILRHLLGRLTGTYQPDHSRSLPPAAWTDGVDNGGLSTVYVGLTTSWGNVDIVWHEPSESELVFAAELLQTYVVDALTVLSDLMAGGSAKDNARAWRGALRGILHAVRGAKNVLLDRLSTVDGPSPMLRQPIEFIESTLASHPDVADVFLSLRVTLLQTLHHVQAYWTAKELQAGDPIRTQSLRYVIRILTRLLHPSDATQPSNSQIHAKWRKLSARDVASAGLHWKKPKTASSIPLWPRRMMQDRVLALYSEFLSYRSFQWSRAIRTHPEWFVTPGLYTEVVSTSLTDLLQLSLVNDSKTRQAAQASLDGMLKRYSPWLETQLPFLVGVVRTSTEKDHVTGALHVLQLGRSLHTVWKKWTTVQALMVALCHASEPKARLSSPDDQIKTQTRALKVFFLLLHTLRDTKGIEGVSLDPLLALEPQMQSHWRHQLMFLACFLPWIRTDTTLPTPVWHVVLRGISSDVPQLQHFGRILLSRLLKAHAALSTNGPVPDLVFAPETLQTLAKDMVANHKSSARSADGQSTDNSPARWSLGVGELFQLVEQERFPPFALSFGQLSSENINLHHVALVQRLARQAAGRNIDLAARWTPGIDTLLADATDERRASLCTVGEILVGIATTTPSFAVLPWLQTILPKLSVPYAQDWYDVVLILTRHGASLEGLVEYVVSQLELAFQDAASANHDGLNQVRWLVLVQPLLLNPLLATGSIVARVHTVARLGLSHPYESVREQVGAVLYKLSLLAQPTEAALRHLVEGISFDATVVVEAELNARKSLLNLIATYIHKGDSMHFSPLLALFPVVFDTQSYPEPDVARSARAVVDTLSNKLRLSDEDTYTRVVDVLEAALSSPSWRSRGAALRFVTVLNFHHGLLQWSKPRIQAMLISRFMDDKRDVQEIAQYALRSFVRTLDDSAVAALATSFLNAAATARKARVKKEKQVKRHRILIERNGPERDDSIKKLHALQEEDDSTRDVQTVQGCFGMGAVVLAYPYSVPPFVPAVLEELSFHLHLTGRGVSYMSEIVKSVLLEFKRTHQDSWHQDKAAFTPTQLEAIQDILISPHYYS
ncbi:hypothetical protein H310_03334 [Aphanomyces invadans]|uniref:Proteasome activator subunit 4 n=1 Tax=Aphanomyces invadans TaxID=157072 RepID=A0A024UHB6_9STRA|nr:hypothetical protein H310_03334 [Aphanomyces invadans]ETW05590.1 hypothetical protein H310_03334 [Aphanomyces invadans]|eukprot:XP_008865367.1 hypothetical protein H310_03334 [Aphanomyces invadans]